MRLFLQIVLYLKDQTFTLHGVLFYCIISIANRQENRWSHTLLKMNKSLKTFYIDACGHVLHCVRLKLFKRLKKQNGLYINSSGKIHHCVILKLVKRLKKLKCLVALEEQCTQEIGVAHQLRVTQHHGVGIGVGW